MTGYLTEKVTAAWNAIKSALGSAETTAEQELTQIESDMLPKFHTLIQTAISTLGAQGYALLKTELVVISTAFLNGSDVGAAIAASVPNVLATLTADAVQDLAAAKNAIYTLIGLEIAGLSNTVPTAAPAP